MDPSSRTHSAHTLTRIAFWSATGATVAAILIRTIALLTAYDSEIGYFSSEAVTVVYRLLVLCAVVGIAICARMIPAEATESLRLPGSANPLAILPMTGLFLLAIYAGHVAWNGGAQQAHAAPATLWWICAVSSLLGAVYFLHCLLGGGSRTAVGLTGLCILPAMICLIALTYSDTLVTMNSPVKLAVQFAALGILLGSISELRFRLDKPAPRLAILLFSVAALLCLGGALPCLIARLAGQIPADRPEGNGLYLVALPVACLYGLYVWSRLCQLCCFSAARPDGPTRTDELDDLMLMDELDEPIPTDEPDEPQVPS